MQKISAVIFDVDNTLYDFTAFYRPAFEAMLDKISDKSGIDQDQLKKEFRAIHQREGTSEFVFAVQDLPSLQKLHPGEDIAELYSDAIHAFRKARKQNLKLYDGVKETLEKLKDSGTRIIAYTESPGYHAMSRLKQLGLDGLLDCVYSMPDHDMPGGVKREDVRLYDKSNYAFAKTEMRHTTPGVLKPNPETLEGIVEELNIDADEILYVGDHLMKDVSMAKTMGLHAAHAAYGSYMGDNNYELLKQLTFWTDEMIEKEKQYHDQPQIAPDVTLSKDINELLTHFDFTAYTGTPKDSAKFAASPFCKTTQDAEKPAAKQQSPKTPKR